MNRRNFLKTTGTVIFGSSVANSLPFLNCTLLKRKPNFVFFLIDDLGRTDLGCYGSIFYETPHIDQLASQGMKFTNAYAACTVCSPTRASILTGKYPARLHLTDWIPGHNLPHAKLKAPPFNQELPLNELTIAEALAKAGYVSASIGKWHLGQEPFYPEKQGFNLNIAGTHKGQPPGYFSPYHIDTLPDGPEGEYLTDRIAVEAIKLIEQNKDKPFFLYVPHFAVHTPIQAKAEIIKKYEAKRNPDQPQHHAAYAAMIESLDHAIGRVLAKSDELNLTENTIIFFTSDNGGLASVTSNTPLRAGKGTAYEGGIRVPLFIRWPGVVKAMTQCDAPVSSIDFYPTILEMAGINLPIANEIDGVSLVPLLKQTGSINRDALYWHYPHYHPGGAAPYSAIRRGDYKLIEFFEDDHLELYHLKEDPGEQNNLVEEMPRLVDELHQSLIEWRKRVNAPMPTPNPDYDPAKEREWSWLRKMKY